MQAAIVCGGTFSIGAAGCGVVNMVANATGNNDEALLVEELGHVGMAASSWWHGGASAL